MKASALGAGALLLGVAAPFAGSPYRTPQHLDVDGLVGQIERGDDHVTALELAGWIRDRKPGLRIIDVRTPEEFAAYSIPTAENIPLDRLARTAFREDETIVLYSEGGAHAGQAWVLLTALGHENIRFIAGGLADWHYDVMAPTLAANASAQDRQAFEKASELSRYFGGEPALGPAQEPRDAETATRLRTPIRRRGC